MNSEKYHYIVGPCVGPVKESLKLAFLVDIRKINKIPMALVTEPVSLGNLFWFPTIFKARVS